MDDPNVASPTASPTTTTEYQLLVTDANGCTDSDEVLVEVEYILDIVLPNAFTPNGDGKNDTYRPVLLGGGTLIDFTIFNRYGEAVFHSTDLSNGWDGTINGKPAELETYLVMARVLVANKEKVETGAVILVR